MMSNLTQEEKAKVLVSIEEQEVIHIIRRFRMDAPIDFVDIEHDDIKTYTSGLTCHAGLESTYCGVANLTSNYGELYRAFMFWFLGVSSIYPYAFFVFIGTPIAYEDENIKQNLCKWQCAIYETYSHYLKSDLYKQLSESKNNE